MCRELPDWLETGKVFNTSAAQMSLLQQLLVSFSMTTASVTTCDTFHTPNLTEKTQGHVPEHGEPVN